MKALLMAGALAGAALMMGGCGSSDNAMSTATYSVTVTNLTYQQPMSPLVVSLHPASEKLFEVGAATSEGLEHLAEGGDNSLLLTEAPGTAVGGNGLILPGGSDTVSVEAEASSCLSLATMLVNTNDAFAGLSCLDLSGLKAGEALTVNIVSYDAGTEANSETTGTILGPAGGGEGYNAARDDRNFVALHGGVVTADDGLDGSALSAAHRWDNPAASVVIRRER
jgi:hypothetical protein